MPEISRFYGIIIAMYFRIYSSTTSLIYTLSMGSTKL